MGLRGTAGLYKRGCDVKYAGNSSGAKSQCTDKTGKDFVVFFLSQIVIKLVFKKKRKKCTSRCINLISFPYFSVINFCVKLISTLSFAKYKIKRNVFIEYLL